MRMRFTMFHLVAVSMCAFVLSCGGKPEKERPLEPADEAQWQHEEQGMDQAVEHLEEEEAGEHPAATPAVPPVPAQPADTSKVEEELQKMGEEELGMPEPAQTPSDETVFQSEQKTMDQAADKLESEETQTKP